MSSALSPDHPWPTAIAPEWQPVTTSDLMANYALDRGLAVTAMVADGYDDETCPTPPAWREKSPA